MKLDELRELLQTMDHPLGVKTIDEFIHELVLNLMESSDSDLDFAPSYALEVEDWDELGSVIDVEYSDCYGLVGDIGLSAEFYVTGICCTHEYQEGIVEDFCDAELVVTKLVLDVCGSTFEVTHHKDVVKLFKDKLHY